MKNIENVPDYIEVDTGQIEAEMRSNILKLTEQLMLLESGDAMCEAVIHAKYNGLKIKFYTGESWFKKFCNRLFY